MPATIGIDFGASKCCVASVRDGKLEVLPNARGEKTTPSFVAFNDRRCLVGSDAKEQATLNPKNTVYGIKSILGRTYMDPAVRNYTRFSSANVFNVQGQPEIKVEYRDRYMSLSPLLIAALQILDMKQQAERVVGEVGGAVVSVPAYFGNSQREAIVAACRIAGLELLDLISEPTATALTYRENRGSISGQETILVVDMGAAKLDVSVVRVSEQEVRVLAVCGDDSLGGDYLNEILMQRIDEEFEDNNHMSLLEDGRAMFELKLACEEIKKKLTLLPYHKVHQDRVLNQKDLIAYVTREKFEKLFARKFSSDLRVILESALSSAGLSKIDIDEVVVVGESSRVPVIQTILSKFFGKKELNRTVNFDMSVATGAAILANELAKEEQHRKFVLHELVRMPENKKEEKPFNITAGSEIERSKSQLETFVQDKKGLENDEKAQNDLEGYCYSVMEEIASFKTFSSEIDKVEDLSQTVLDWVEKNCGATVEECKKEEDCLRETWRKFNENVKKNAECNLAAIEASIRQAEQQEAEKKRQEEQQEAEKKRQEEQQEAEKKRQEAEKKRQPERQVVEKRQTEQPKAEKKRQEEQQEAEKKKKQKAKKKKREAEEIEKRLSAEIKSNGIHERKISVSENRNSGQPSSPSAQSNRSGSQSYGSGFQSNVSGPQYNGSWPQSNLLERQSNRSESQSNHSAPQSNRSEPQSNGSGPQYNRSEPQSNRSGPQFNRSGPQSNGSGPQSNGSGPQSNRSEPQSNRSGPQFNRSEPQSNGTKQQSSSVFGTPAFPITSQNTSHTFRGNEPATSLHSFGGASVHPKSPTGVAVAVTSQENSASTAPLSNSGAPNSGLRCSQQTPRTGGSPPGVLSVSGPSDPTKSVDAESPSSESGVYSDVTSPSS